MRFWALLLSALVLMVLTGPARAQTIPIPPSPTQWVTDNVGLLSASTQSSVNERLRAYERSTGHQVIVWIGDTTGDDALEDWTIKAFTAWKIGRKGVDDGAVLFLFTQDRKARIEVGYGLEGQLTDAIASEIIRHDVEPNMRANDPDAAVTSAVTDMLATIGGENGAAPNAPQYSDDNVSFSTIILIFVLVLVLITIIGRFARAGAPFIIGSGWSGSGWGGFSGGGGGGGGFSGGGGMGGGGGASGGW